MGTLFLCTSLKEIDAAGLTLLPGVETSLPLMLTRAMQGRCTVAQVSNWMSTAVAKADRIPNKGAIAPGYDADVILVDLERYRPVEAQNLSTKFGWSLRGGI